MAARANTENGNRNPFGPLATLNTRGGAVQYHPLSPLSRETGVSLDRLPFSIRVLLENVLREADGQTTTADDVLRLAKWQPKSASNGELPFRPGRVILQDFTGVPAIVDLAAMRAAMKRLGGDPTRIDPQVPCDLVIDHSVQVDAFGSAQALTLNKQREFERNRERYEFLKWGQQAFQSLRVVPPATGIIHQVNLEYLAQVVLTRKVGTATLAFPDTLVGTDSHTTMINGLGVLGWGVGGIEAEAAMLGQPLYMLTPAVVGFRLTGKLPEGSNATDLVLAVTQMLRAKGVVNKFVEFFGPALASMSLPDRATVANMAPEYGATMGFFPVDDETLAYLRLTGRPAEHVDLVERYCKEQGLFRTADAPEPAFSEMLELDLGTIVPAVAGPKRPQDRIPLKDLKQVFRQGLSAPVPERGYGLSNEALSAQATADGETLKHGAVVIAAITSCTNTSNPSVMLEAGLLARKAIEHGLRVPKHVKTSLSPGSRVVSDYLDRAGVTAALDQLGFQNTGYGCMTCIGNSGPLPEAVAKAITQGNLIASAVLSGNRNFEGRVNPLTKANYLASPALVVAFALAGTTDIDLATEPVGKDPQGNHVFLQDIWPTQAEVAQAMAAAIGAEQFRNRYAHVFEGEEQWQQVAASSSELYPWSADSTYIQEPPFFQHMTRQVDKIEPIRDARCLLVLGDSVTTDHISPAGNIKADSPAGQYLQSLGVEPADFNSYGSRRGNDRVMTRGTFANIRIRNLLAPGTEGGVTLHLPTHQPMSVYGAAMAYQQSRTALIVLAGREYGTGSSRDWAAKGAALLGVRAVIAISFERIHRSNLVGMAVLPLQFKEGQTCESLGLSGRETYAIDISDTISPLQDVAVTATTEDGKVTRFITTCRIDTPVEINYYRNGGILQTVLRNLLD